MAAFGFASPEAIARFRLLQPHLEDDVPLTRVAAGGGLSERTLRRWLAAYRADGIGGLERTRRADAGTRRRLDPDLEAFVRAMATKRPRPTVAAIHRKLAAEARTRGVADASYAVIADIARQVRAARITVATDPAAYRDRHELVHRRDAGAPNEMWQADHTLLDILLVSERGEPVRPWLTVVMDDHSRAVAGTMLTMDAPSAANTALALRHAIWRKADPAWPVCGIPEVLYVDNGSDFVSEQIEQACIALKIRLVHSRPGRPRGRGKIERLFRTVNEMFLPDVPGHLIRGRPLSAPAIDLAELTARFERFLNEVYHRRPHGTIGEAPVARWQAGGFLPALPESRAALDMARCCACLAPARSRATASASWGGAMSSPRSPPSWASRSTSFTIPETWPRSTSTTTARSCAARSAPSTWTPPRWPRSAARDGAPRRG